MKSRGNTPESARYGVDPVDNPHNLGVKSLWKSCEDGPAGMWRKSPFRASGSAGGREIGGARRPAFSGPPGMSQFRYDLIRRGCEREITWIGKRSLPTPIPHEV